MAVSPPHRLEVFIQILGKKFVKKTGELRIMSTIFRTRGVSVCKMELYWCK